MDLRPTEAPAAHQTSGTALDAQAKMRKLKRARARLNAAFAAKVAGNEVMAKEALEDAVRLDPDLIMDKGAISLTTTLYSIPIDQSSALLFEISQQPINRGHYRPDLRITFIALQTGLEAVGLLIVCVVFATLAYLLAIRAGAEALSQVPTVSQDDVTAAYRVLGGSIFKNAFESGVQWWIALMAGTLTTYWMGIVFGGIGVVGRYIRFANRVYLVAFSAMAAGLTIVLGNVGGTVNINLTVAGLWVVYGAFAASFGALVVIASRVHKLRLGRAILSVFLGNVILGLAIVILGLLN